MAASHFLKTQEKKKEALGTYKHTVLYLLSKLYWIN